MSIKSWQLWSQLGLANQYQEPIEREAWINGQHLSTPIDVSKMDTVPMSFIMGGNDQTAAPADQTPYIEQIEADYEVLTIDYRGHGYFDNTASTEYFMRHLIEQLELHM